MIPNTVSIAYKRFFVNNFLENHVVWWYNRYSNYKGDKKVDSLIYSLNATMPVFLTIFIGYILKRIKMTTPEFVTVANKFNFKVTLPAMLFLDLAATDIRSNFDIKYVLFCAAVTTVMFFAIWIGARLFIKDKSIIGAFVQSSYRSSAAVLGVAFIMNIYGTSGMAPIMIIGCVPLYNIYAVIVLTLEGEGNTDGAKAVKQSIVNIAKNPIILSIAAGVVASLINLRLPVIISKTINNFSVMASPLALVAIGAGFEGRKAIAKIKPTMVSAFIKTVVLPGVFLPVAIKLGFHDQELVALIIMLGSPTTPSSYIMAKNMHNDGVLSSSVIVTTTLLSSLTLTFWIFIARAGGFIA